MSNYTKVSYSNFLSIAISQAKKVLFCWHFPFYFSLLELDREHITPLHVLPGYVRKQKNKHFSVSTHAVVVAAVQAALSLYLPIPAPLPHTFS